MITITTKTDPEDLPWLVRQIQTSYWGDWLNEGQILEAVKNSLCFWAIHYQGEIGVTVGFARVVTDQAIFSSITDCFIVREYQRLGIGSQMMNAIFEHPHIKPTICVIATRDAPRFYAKHGFVMQVSGVMKRSPQ